MHVLKRQRWEQALLPAIVVLVIVAAWWAVVAVVGPPAWVLPSPSRVWERFMAEWQVIARNLASTVRVALTGFAVSFLIGAPLGLAVGWWPVVRRVLMPPILVTQSIPKIAIAPLLVVWFGFGSFPRILVVIMITIFPAIIGGMVGASQVNREMINLARTMGCSGLAFARKVVLPAAAPHLAAGFRIGASLALIGAIIAEYVGATKGIGTLLLRAAGNQDTALTFAAILSCVVVGALIYVAATLLTRVAGLAWDPEHIRSST